MKVPGVAWFDGVFQDELGRWVLDAVAMENGRLEHRQVPFQESAGMDMTSLGQWSQMRTETFFDEASIFLGYGQRLMDARAVIRKLWPGLPVSDRHAVFRFDVGERVYLLPALFIIGRLFLSVRSVAKYILQPGMFESFIPASKVKAPLIEGCVAWLECKVIPEPHNEKRYDLFLGEVVGAWADPRAFKDGRWVFEDEGLKTIHYIAGGNFFATGDAFEVAEK